MPIHDSWILPEPIPDLPPLPLSSPLIRSILVRRGICSDEEFRRFAHPSIEDLHPPGSIHGIDYACDRITRAIRDREMILIYGDYDVDGVTSIVLLKTVLALLGAEVDFVVPHRLVDGYGLKIEVLERVLLERSVGLVITVDCGITSVEPVEKALERGIDVIITDHHLPPESLPRAAAVLNPHQEGCDYPFKELAGVGVAFKLCCELIRRFDKRISIDSLLKIASIGTIADVAPLIGENRTIARLGLLGLSDPRNPGLRTLVRLLGLLGKPLRSSDVGFKIGPRINAAGRLASADTAIRLFAAANEIDAYPLVQELNRLNQQRQQVEAKLLEEAEEAIARMRPLPPLLFLAKEGWHRGVLGLCAGRLAQKYHRPTLVIAIEQTDCVGSGRSIETINLHERLSEARHSFTHFGGHEFACGFAFRRADLETVRAGLEASFSRIDPAAWDRTLLLDGTLQIVDLAPPFHDEHSVLEPFGAGNPQPNFLLHDVRCTRMREFSPGCFELTLVDEGGTARGVLWPSKEQLLDTFRSGEPLDAVVQIDPDPYAPQGLRLSICDARAAQ